MSLLESVGRGQVTRRSRERNGPKSGRLPYTPLSERDVEDEEKRPGHRRVTCARSLLH